MLGDELTKMRWLIQKAPSIIVFLAMEIMDIFIYGVS
jgi:hypothetical protein